MDLLGRLSRSDRKAVGGRAQEHDVTATLPATSRTRARARRLTPTQLDDLVSARQAGASINDLAEQFGIHRSTATAHLQRHGVRPRSDWSPGQLELAIRLYESGGTLQTIAAQLDCAPSTVGRHLHAAGVALRSRGGSRGRAARS